MRVALVITLAMLVATAAWAGDVAQRSPARVIFVSDVDGDSDVYAADRDGRRVAVMTRNRVGDGQLIVSPDGRWLAIESDFEKTVLLRADARSERRLGDGTPSAFSPDGEWLLIGHVPISGVWRTDLIPTDGGTRRRFLGRSPGSFAPDGRTLLLHHDRTEALIVATLSGRPRLIAGTSGADNAVWSPDGQRLAYLTGRRVSGGDEVRLSVVAASGDRKPRILAVGGGIAFEWLGPSRIGAVITDNHGRDRVVVLGMAGGRRLVAEGSADWSPDGERVAVSGADRVELIDIVTGRRRSLAPTRGVPSLLWSPSGRLIAHTSSRGGSSEGLRVSTAAGRSGRELLVSREPIRLWGWSPDESQLALTVDGDAAVLTVASGRLKRLTVAGNVWGVVWARGSLPQAAPTAPPPPATATVTPAGLVTLAEIEEIAADGTGVAALLSSVQVDCAHAVGWRLGRQSTVRFSRQAPCLPDNPPSRLDLSLVRNTLAWSSIACSPSTCWHTRYRADLNRPGTERPTTADVPLGEEDPRPRPPPPPVETRQGITASVERGAVLLRGPGGATRRIRPAGPVVDIELEDVGLYYAFNSNRRGRLTFVPFSRLLTG
jgi:Tol biopolymer transport system component